MTRFTVSGSVRQRAERLYTIMNSKEDALPLSLLKGAKRGKKQQESIEILRPVAEREFLVRGLCDELRDVVNNTQAFNEKKTIQSYEERQKDEMEMVVSEEEAEHTADLIRSKVGGDVEVTCISGGQPVYYYMLGVE